MIRRVLFCGAWDEGDGYPRAAALRLGLQRAGVQVDECRAAAMGNGKLRLLRSPWRLLGWLLAAPWRRVRFAARLRQVLRERAPDVIVVPYPGHHLVASVVNVARVPVVLDLFLSAYDTAVGDRRLFAPGSLPARLLRGLDRSACRKADLVLVDTEANADFVADLTALPRSHFAALPIGDAAAPTAPMPYRPPTPGALRVLFFGTGVPLHGLATLIDAVASAPAVRLVLVGGTADDRRRAVARLGARVDLQPEFVPGARLQELIRAADLVAGVFGSGDKARRVVPYKVVHALAAGRPVITADTPAIRSVLGDGEGAVLVPAGDATALAERLQALAIDPAPLAAVAARARAVHDRCFAVDRTGVAFAALLTALAQEAAT